MLLPLALASDKQTTIPTSRLEAPDLTPAESRNYVIAIIVLQYEYYQ